MFSKRHSDEESNIRWLKYQLRISKKGISYFIDEVCKAIVTVLAWTYLKFPSYQEGWKNIEKKFQDKWNFPQCIGYVDGKHIEIIGCGMRLQYDKYKGTNSIVLLVVVGSNYEVNWADVVGMNRRMLSNARRGFIEFASSRTFAW